MGDTVKHRAAVVAEGRRQEREHLPFVLLARLGTRKRGPGKPGPTLWSDPVAEIERRRCADRYIPREWLGERKALKPIPAISRFPCVLAFYFLSFLYRALPFAPTPKSSYEAKATR